MATFFSDYDVSGVDKTQRKGWCYEISRPRPSTFYHPLAYVSALIDPFYKPIPLDLLTLEDFTDLPTQRGTGLLRGFGGGNRGDNRNDAQANTPGMSLESATDSRVICLCTILPTGRLGGLYTLYAESAQARSEWMDKLQEAIGVAQRGKGVQQGFRS